MFRTRTNASEAAEAGRNSVSGFYLDSNANNSSEVVVTHTDICGG